MNITTNDFSVIEKVFPNAKAIISGISKRPEGSEFIEVSQLDGQKYPTVSFKVVELTATNLIPILEMVKNHPNSCDVSHDTLRVCSFKKGFAIEVEMPGFAPGVLHKLATGEPMW